MVRVSIESRPRIPLNQRMTIQVEHHADLGAAPRSLYRGERRVDIIEIMDQWYGRDYRYVKVRGRDSSVDILLVDEIRDQWELIMFSAANAQRLERERYDLARSAQSRQ
jgi:hypothetical protein